MKILILYRKVHPWTAGEYLEKALKKEHLVNFLNLDETPYWTNYYGILPFFIPKRKPMSFKNIIKEKFNNEHFDLVIEVDGLGQYYVEVDNNLKLPAIFWGIDHDYSKKFFLNYISKKFDYFFYCHKNYINNFTRKCIWLPVACDPDINKKFNLKKIYDVVFVGNLNFKYSKDRIKLLKLIGQKFNLKVVNGVFGEEMAKIYSQSKIVFNKSVNNDLNMRVFETLSCGSLLLTDRLSPETGLEELFQDKKHLVLYDNETDLLEKIDYYLTHESEREEIAYNGHKEVLVKHTYDHRVKKILEVVFEKQI